MPERIANAPELYLGLQLYLQAFFDLDSERSHSMGVTMIPWSAIKDYSTAYDFDEEQSESLLYLIRQIDIAHTKRIASKQHGSKPA